MDKKRYPDYQHTGTAFIEEQLTAKENKVLSDFLRLCRTTASESRVNQKIKAELLQFKDIIGNLLNWKHRNIENFLILLNDSERTEWTKNDIKKTMRRFIRFYYKDDTLLNLIKCKSNENAFNYERINENTLINLEEFEKILKSCNTLKQKAILSLLFETGCRPQELRSLKWGDVKIEDSVGNITFYSSKTRKSRTIPIRDCIVHLKRYKEEFEFSDIKDNDYVFPNDRDRNKPLSDNALPMMFRRLSKKAGLNRNIFPYLCRHSRLTLINQKMPIHLATKFAGHSVKQSQLYTHLSSDDLRVAMLKLWKVKDISPEYRHKLEKEIKEINERFENKEKENLERFALLQKEVNRFKENLKRKKN